MEFYCTNTPHATWAHHLPFLKPCPVVIRAGVHVGLFRSRPMTRGHPNIVAVSAVLHRGSIVPGINDISSHVSRTRLCPEVAHRTLVNHYKHSQRLGVLQCLPGGKSFFCKKLTYYKEVTEALCLQKILCGVCRSSVAVCLLAVPTSSRDHDGQITRFRNITLCDVDVG